MSSKSITDMRSIRAPCVCFATARRMPSIWVAALAVTRPVTAIEPPTTRGAAAGASPTSQAGAERSNCTTYCSASLSNAARSPWRCSKSKSASQASTESLVSMSFSMPSSSWRRASSAWPFANRSAAFSSTAHKPGFACATSKDAWAGAHCARLAPVTVMSPPAGSMMPPRTLGPPARRARARRPREAWNRTSAVRGFFLAGGFEKKAIANRDVVEASIRSRPRHCAWTAFDPHGRNRRTPIPSPARLCSRHSLPTSGKREVRGAMLRREARCVSWPQYAASGGAVGWPNRFAVARMAHRSFQRGKTRRMTMKNPLDSLWGTIIYRPGSDGGPVSRRRELS